MNNFHFSKVIAGVWPTLAKETVLSKVINMVDVFRLSLSGGFDDNNKKYIETIMKLDNSKTIMLETKWCDIRVKNLQNINLKKWQTINLDYSEYAQDNDKQIFVDYSINREDIGINDLELNKFYEFCLNKNVSQRKFRQAIENLLFNIKEIRNQTIEYNYEKITLENLIKSIEEVYSNDLTKIF